jgi:hypothetical protein
MFEYPQPPRHASIRPQLSRAVATPACAESPRVLASLPGSAHLTTHEAALYLRTSQDVLRVWRARGKGPRYRGRGHFVRYAKSDLDDYMAGFDHRFQAAPCEGPTTVSSADQLARCGDVGETA